MATPEPIDVTASIDRLDFLPDRTPTTGETDAEWATRLAPYRDGGVFAVHYAGQSEWERHPVGDEIVIVVDGSTTMTLLLDGQEQRHTLGPLQMIVVPQGVWHRFDTPDGAKVMTVTPQPTDHRVDHPSSG